MRSVCVSVAVLGWVACASAPPAEPDQPRTPPSDVPAPATSYELVLRHAAADADRVCACPDLACLERVEAERTSYVDHLPEDHKASEAEKAEARRINLRRDQCRGRLFEAMSTTHESELEALIGPECVAYLAQYERLAGCDKLGAARDGMRDAIRIMRESFQRFADLEPDARAAALAAAGPACRQGSEALRQTAESLGCPP